jgi:hypothetical protein
MRRHGVSSRVRDRQTCMYPPPHVTCMYPPPHTEHAETRRELEAERQALMHSRLDLDATQVYICENIDQCTCMCDVCVRVRVYSYVWHACVYYLRACLQIATLLAILRDLDVCMG